MLEMFTDFVTSLSGDYNVIGRGIVVSTAHARACANGTPYDTGCKTGSKCDTLKKSTGSMETKFKEIVIETFYFENYIQDIFFFNSILFGREHVVTAAGVNGFLATTYISIYIYITVTS